MVWVLVSEVSVTVAFVGAFLVRCFLACRL